MRWGTKLRIEGAWRQTKERVNDEFLMDQIVEKLKKAHILMQINNVRLYLKLYWLSNIVAFDGSNIYEWAMHPLPFKSKLK